MITIAEPGSLRMFTFSRADSTVAVDYARMTDRLGRRGFLVGIAGMTTELASRARAEPQNSNRAADATALMYVGSFTSDGRGHGEGLSVFRRESNKWTLVQVLKELADPSFVIINRQRSHLYSAHGDGTEATAYRIDETTGRLTVLN